MLEVARQAEPESAVGPVRMTDGSLRPALLQSADAIVGGQALYDLQVLQPIVRLVLVEVVDLLTGAKAPMGLFPYIPMLVDAGAVREREPHIPDFHDDLAAWRQAVFMMPTSYPAVEAWA